MFPIELSITGERAAEIVTWIETHMSEEFGVRPDRRVARQERMLGIRAPDPLALATFILTIPPAILAVLELADRLDKCRKFRVLLEELRDRSSESGLTITVHTATDTHDLESMNADELEMLADALDPEVGVRRNP